jgi:hypothetical protein
LAKAPSPGFRKLRVQFANRSTLEAGRLLKTSVGSRPLLLNFANGLVPGGGFLHGARAQEESLCRSSALYATLQGDPMYQAHADMADDVSSDWAILSRDVPVFRDEAGTPLPQPWFTDFLTCAAPVADWMDAAQAASLLDKRISCVLSIAMSHRYKAWSLAHGVAAPSETILRPRPAASETRWKANSQVPYPTSSSRSWTGPPNGNHLQMRQSCACPPSPNDLDVFRPVQFLDTSSAVHLRSASLKAPEAIMPSLFPLPYNTSSLRSQHRRVV